MLKSRIKTIALEYEGLGSKSCLIMLSKQAIRCGVLQNNDSNKREGRLWLVINGNLRFDMKQIYTYYVYLTITSTTPSSTLIHLTNKEIQVFGTNFINTYELTCVFIPDLVDYPIFTEAIFVSQNELICPLTYQIFENNLVKLHVTNNYERYFQKFNLTMTGGRLFTVQKRLDDNLDLSKVNN